MHTRLLICIFFSLATVSPAAPAFATQQATAPPAAAPHAMPRLFLDCDRCDSSYIRREVTFVDHVRNREDADVHVLVTGQRTGGGGTQWTLKFIGVGAHQGSDQSMVYNSSQTATADEIRAGLVEVLKLGLVRYAVLTPIADRLRVTLTKSEADEKPAATQTDPWNFWVYRVGGSGDLNGEESSEGRSIRGSFSASRTTDAWRMSFNTNANYRDTAFKLDDDEIEGGKTTFLSVSRNLDASAVVVKSLSQHWSLGLMGSASSQTFRNYILRSRIAPGIEYNFFPYSESTRRMLTVEYTIGYNYHRYRDITIFDKLREQLADQRAEVGLSMRQPWGGASVEFNFSQYLSDPSKYSLGVDGGTSVRLFKGFTINTFGEFSRTRDQIYLRRGTASTEEILLRQRQLATGYQYQISFGFGYSFGSIYNNIVNPRFGGGGGGRGGAG